MTAPTTAASGGRYAARVGVSRRSLRVSAYAFLLVTDEYPPFTLKAA